MTIFSLLQKNRQSHAMRPKSLSVLSTRFFPASPRLRPDRCLRMIRKRVGFRGELPKVAEIAVVTSWAALCDRMQREAVNVLLLRSAGIFCVLLVLFQVFLLQGLARTSIHGQIDIFLCCWDDTDVALVLVFSLFMMWCERAGYFLFRL